MASGLAEGLELRFVGSRFDGGTLPFDALPDLSAFRDLLTAIAKSLWLRENPSRQNLPRYFSQSIAFDLVAIGQGSAVPKIRWDRQRASEKAPALVGPLNDLLDRSFVETAKIFQQAGQDKLPAALPADQIAALNRFGSSLRDGERIEFVGQTDENNNVIYLDVFRHRKIVTKVRETYTAPFAGSGILITSSSKGYITVLTKNFGELNFEVAPSIVEEHYDGNLGSEVQFEVEIECDGNDQFKRVASVMDLTIVNASDDPGFIKAMARINELRGRSAGWLDGGGEAVSQRAVRAARALLDRRPAVAIGSSIFATADGGLNVEFERDGWDLSFEFMPTGQIDYYGVELAGDGMIDTVTFEKYEDALVAFDERFSSTGGE